MSQEFFINLNSPECLYCYLPLTLHKIDIPEVVIDDYQCPDCGEGIEITKVGEKSPLFGIPDIERIIFTCQDLVILPDFEKGLWGIAFDLSTNKHDIKIWIPSFKITCDSKSLNKKIKELLVFL